jgi:hypothetical protein
VTLLDERGRIAGRFNAVDLCAALVLFLLVPLGIGAYVLFRSPAPTLAAITPKTLTERATQRIEVDGTNLRPFMRVTFDTVPASSFLLGSTKYALVDVPALRPGVYDVVLYDYAREVARLPKALTIVAPAPDVELEVEGAFQDVSDQLAAQLVPGASLRSAERPLATIVSVGTLAPGALRLKIGSDTVALPSRRRNLNATLRVKCATVRSSDGSLRCAVPDQDQPTVIAPDVLLTFALPGGPVGFQVATVQAPSAGRPPR